MFDNDIVRYKYIGSDAALRGCEASNLELDLNGTHWYKVRGEAIRRIPIIWYGYAYEVIGKIYYVSWVGFLKDWTQIAQDS